MKKKDLKTNDSAELRDGSIVILSGTKTSEGKSGFVGSGTMDFDPKYLLEDYNQDLTHKKIRHLDVVTIYRQAEVMFRRPVTMGQPSGSIIDFRPTGRTISIGEHEDQEGVYWVYGFPRGLRYENTDVSVKYMDAIIIKENNFEGMIKLGTDKYHLLDISNVLGFWRREYID